MMKPGAALAGSLLSLALGAWLGYAALYALYSGVARAGDREYKRKTKPLMYWLAFCIQTLFSLICLYVATKRIADPSS